jgi:hypothetical protein
MEQFVPIEIELTVKEIAVIALTADAEALTMTEFFRQTAREMLAERGHAV